MNDGDRWDGNTRADGVLVQKADNGNWQIKLPSGHTIFACPCCGAFLTDDSKARLVADRYWPRLR